MAEQHPSIAIRAATGEDAPSIGRVLRATMRESLPFLPELHTPEEDLWFVRERLLAEHEVWVAAVAEQVVGYIAYRPGWIEGLYVLPEYQRRGLGRVLLSRALMDGSERRLWTFQENELARRFYERVGFVAERFTDGHENEERRPAILYRRSATVGSGG